MTQQQQDAYKQIIGDGNAEVVVGRSVSHKSFGAGGDVFISVKLKCDQSGTGIATATEYAKQFVESRIWPQLEEMKVQLVRRGILER